MYRCLSFFGLVLGVFFSQLSAPSAALYAKEIPVQLEELGSDVFLEHNISARMIDAIDLNFEQNRQRYDPNNLLIHRYYFLDLKSKTLSKQHKWALSVNFANFDYVNFIIPTSDHQVRVVNAGDELALSSDTLSYRYPAVIVNPNDVVPSFVVLQVSDISNIFFTASITEEKELNSTISQSYIFYGLYIGILITFMLSNLLVFVYTKEKNHLAYVLYLSLFSLTTLSMNGLGQLLLWPRLNGFTTQFSLSMIGLSLIAISYFTYSFLDLQRNGKRFVPAFIAISTIILVLAIVANLFHARYVQNPFLVACTVQLLLIFSASLHGYRTQGGPALYLLIGHSLLFPTIILSVLKYSGIVQNNFLFANGLEICLLLEAFILSSGLAEKISLLQKSNIQTMHKLVANKQRYLKNLLNVREKEKREFSGILHNTVAQNLAVIKSKLEHLSDNNASKDIADLVQYTDQTLSDVRNISHLDHPHILEAFGLQKAVEHYAERNLDSNEIDWRCEIDETLLAPEQHLTLYRIIQEAINNVFRHSQASLITISLTKLDATTNQLLVSDDGVGLEQNSDGFGIASIREYAEILGSSLQIRASAKYPTILDISFSRKTLKPKELY